MLISTLGLRFHIVASVLVVFSPVPAIGQGLVTAPYPTEVPTVVFHYQRPDFAKDFNYTSLHGTYEAELIVPLNSHYFAFATVPLGVAFNNSKVIHENDTIPSREAGALVGNITLGFGHRFAIGERLGLANSFMLLLRTMPSVELSDAQTYYAYFTGVHSDYYRGERFANGYWTLETNSQLRCQLNEFVGINCEIRPQWSVSGSGGVNWLSLNAGAALQLGVPSVRLVSEYVLSWQVLPSTPGYYIDHLGIGVCVSTRRFEPTLYYQFVLKSLQRERVHGVIGIRIEVPLELERP